MSSDFSPKIGDGKMETAFTCHIDKTAFSQKPKGAEIGGIKNRLHEEHGRKTQTETTIELLSMAIQKGCTIQPCCTYNEDDLTSPSLDKDGNQKYDRNGNPLYKQKYTFISQQLFLADLDNEGKDKQRLPDGEYMTLDRIGDILQENGLSAFIAYHSFSSKPEWEKFRVGILVDEPITDLEERNKCILAVFKLFGMATDEKCTNIDRLFFGSTPDSILFNDGCTVSKQVLLQLYDKLFKPELDAQATLDGNQSEETAVKPLNTSHFVPTAPTHTGGIDKALSPDFDPNVLLSMIDPCKLSYEEWITVSAAYKTYEAGGQSLDFWLQWCSSYPNDDRKADIATWNSLTGEGISKGTLLKFAQLHSPQRYEDYKQAMNPFSPKHRTSSGHDGNQSNKEQAQQQHKKYVSPYDVDGTGRLSIPNLRAFVQAKNILIAYDEILRKTVCKTNGNGKNKQLLGNLLLSTIESELQSELRGVTAEKISRYLDVIADENRINPIRSMIEAAQWDGKDRLEEWYQLFQIPETDTLSRTLIRKWAMQAVCGLYNDIERPFSLDIVLIFQGAQGIGKTRFFEHLAMLPPYFREGVVLDVTNKDSIMQATSAWLCELGEIGSTMRKDIDRLKAFLTLSMDTFRVPYARLADEYPRKTSFVGTVNDERFLLDQTGNRRFASVPLQLTHTLDYETQIKTFDALQFWAQILQIVRDAIANGATIGGCFRLDETEKQNLETRNSSLLKLLPFEQEFLDTIQYYEERKAKSPKSVEWRFCTSTDWLVQNRYRMGNCSSVQLGKILAKNGYERKMKKINGIPKYGYELPFDLPQTLC